MRFVWLFGVTLLLSGVASATTARKLSVEELRAHADLVVVGRVIARESYWEGTRIYTRATLTIEETWRGKAPGAYVDVHTLGGVVGDIGQRVAGAPEFPLGQHVVAVLQADARGRYYPVGLWQGVYVLTVDSQGTPHLHQPTNGGELIPGAAPISLPDDLGELKRALSSQTQ